MTIVELREKRAKAIADARKLIDTADARTGDTKGKLTAEERQAYDRAMADAGSLKTDIEQREALESEERSLSQSAGRRTTPEEPGTEQRDAGKPTEIEFRGKKMS